MSDNVGPPESYQHDPAQVPALAKVVDRACEGVLYPHEVSAAIKRLAAELDPPPDSAGVAELECAFYYLLNPTPVGSAQPGASLALAEIPHFC